MLGLVCEDTPSSPLPNPGSYRTDVTAQAKNRMEAIVNILG